LPQQKTLLNAVKWSYLGNWSDRGVSAIFTVILASVLGPKDFGTVSVALIYIGFLQLFLHQGFITALVQRKELAPEHWDSVFWMDQALSVFLVGVSFLLSGWWAAKNHAPHVTALIAVLSLSIPIEASAGIQGAMLSRAMDFKSLSIRGTTAALLGGLVGIEMAFSGFGVWALVGQQLVRDSTSLVLLWTLSAWRPRLGFSWKHLKELAGFSSSTFAAQLALYADAQASSILLGLFVGPVAVGLYRLADRVTNSVQVMATSSIQAVSLPEFSRNQDNPQELRRSAITCLRLSSALSFPALAGLAAVSGPLTAVIGPEWAPAAGVIRILSILGIFAVVCYFTGPSLQALSRPGQVAVLEWARAVVGTGLLVTASVLVRNRSVSFQVTGIAAARFVLGAFLVTPVYVSVFMRACKLSWRDLAASVGPGVVASASVVGSVTLFHASGALVGNKPVILLIAEAAVGGAIGLAVLLTLQTELRNALARMLPTSVSRLLGFSPETSAGPRR
jgi:PST family polysaccharide transporter